MSLNVPHHELLEILRHGKDRVVYRSRYNGQATVTRVILRPVPVELAGLIEGVVTSGVGSLAGMDEEIIATLEGYRVRSRLSGPGLPGVCAAGLAADPTRCARAFGLPFITTRWMPGETLRAAALPMTQRPGILRGVLKVLAGIHKADVAYGDLKPQNIVLGPDGVGLIDLDTLRQVPAAHLPIRVTHRTPRYAAPEQDGDHPLLYLASDIYTLGLLVCELLGDSRPGEVGFPPRLEAPWDAVADACLRRRPLDRPPASVLLSHLERPDGPLPTWSGALFAPVTEPVRSSSLLSQPTIRVEDPVDQTARVAEPPQVGAEQTQRVAEPPQVGAELKDIVTAAAAPPEAGLQEPAPEERRRIPSSILLVVGLLSIAALGTVLAGGLWVHAQLQLRQQADAESARLLESLKIHKTVPAENTLAVLSGIREEADAALAISETPELLGLLALSTVWTQKWHWSSASWDDARYAEGAAVIARADAAGPTVTGLLASGVLTGGACRLMPDADATLRRTRCEESLASIDKAWQRIRWDDSLDWLAVEVQWAGVMTGGALAGHFEARGDAEEARAVRKAAMARCQSGHTRLSAAPVNGEELLQSCLSIAGPAGRFSEYMKWAAWLVGNDLETTGSVSSSTRELIFEGVHPECHGMRFYRSGIPQIPTIRGGQIDLCRYVGMMALGCPDIAEGLRDCKRESWGIREQRCMIYNQAEGIPWRSALSETAELQLSDCML
ncbi:MAG: hypothetical protein P8R54_01610 [Myxococcota bacterium]|nr:hypothetical protein [Myxococcota bacterium]